MPEIDVGYGYWLVDSWDDVLYLEVATAIPDEDLRALMNHKANGLAADGELDILSLTYIGDEQLENDGDLRKLRRIWVRKKNSRFVPAEKGERE